MNVVETTRSLVRIPSVNPGYDPESPGEQGMTDWLLTWARTHAFEVTTQEVFPGRCNVILRLRNGADRPHLLLNGHTDTVAVKDMTVAPFDAEMRDDRVWGRGAADMKGSLACMLHALLAIREGSAHWRGTVTLACVVDEEVGFAGIRHFLKSNPACDFAIVGEPTRFEVVRGCKGCLRFFVRARGKAAHSSTPEKGVSAISAMARAVLAMDRYFAESLATVHHPSLGCSTGSVGTIRGGNGVNIVPEFCETEVDIRLVPGQSGLQTYAEIRNIVEAQDDRIQWEFDPHPLVDSPFCRDADDLFVRMVCGAVVRTESQVVNFSCDASKIAAAGIPCLIFGPGDITQAHTGDESLAIEDLHRGVSAYVQIVEKLLAL